MIWPVAALALVILVFAFAYGSLVQSRFERGRSSRD
jgi:hypothetical protein